MSVTSSYSADAPENIRAERCFSPKRTEAEYVERARRDVIKLPDQITDLMAKRDAMPDGPKRDRMTRDIAYLERCLAHAKGRVERADALQTQFAPE